MFVHYPYLMQQPAENLEDSIPESLAMMVSFLWKQLRTARERERSARDETTRMLEELRIEREVRRKAEVREGELRSELAQFKEAKPAKRGKK